MATLMAILGIMNGVKAMSSGDRLGGALGVLGSVAGSGWFNSTPSYNNSMGDFGVRRNYL